MSRVLTVRSRSQVVHDDLVVFAHELLVIASTIRSSRDAVNQADVFFY